MGRNDEPTNFGQSLLAARARPPFERCASCGHLCALIVVSWPDWARSEGDYWFVPGCLVCSTSSRVAAVWSGGRWEGVDGEFAPRPASGPPARFGAYATELGRAARERRPDVAVSDPERLDTLWQEVMGLPYADHFYVRIWLLLVVNPHMSLSDARRFIAAHPHATGWESVPDPAPPSISWGHRGEELAQERAVLRRRLQQDFAWVAPDNRATTSDGRRWVAYRIGEEIRVGLDPLGDEPHGSWYFVTDPATPPVVQPLHPAPPEEAHMLLRRYLTEMDPVAHASATTAWQAVDQPSDGIYGPEVLHPVASVEQRLREIASAHLALTAALAAPDVRALRAATVDPASLLHQAVQADGARRIAMGGPPARAHGRIHRLVRWSRS